ncbi:MAG: hypothetical protein HY650_16700 [Acidobacteria bacterium]|nr:hypothetical protein [Acidobacteriota bacterium]
MTLRELGKIARTDEGRRLLRTALGIHPMLNSVSRLVGGQAKLREAVGELRRQAAENKRKLDELKPRGISGIFR